MNAVKDLTPCERFTLNVVRASTTPLTLADIQRLTGYRTMPIVRTSVKYLVKGRLLVESTTEESAVATYTARVPPAKTAVK